MSELAKKIEAGEGYDRDLNLEVAKFLGWRTIDSVWYASDAWLAPWETESDKGSVLPPNLLESIDAISEATRRLFPNAYLSLGVYLNQYHFRADPIHQDAVQCGLYPDGNHQHKSGQGGSAKTEARARLAALVRAVEARPPSVS